MPAIICINKRGGIKGEDGTYHGPFRPVDVSERYYQRRYLRDRMTYTVEDYEYHLTHVWDEGTIRQIARNAGLPHTEPIEVLRELLSTEEPEVEALEPDPRRELIEALASDEYNRVRSLVAVMYEGATPRKRDDLYALARRLSAGEEE